MSDYGDESVIKEIIDRAIEQNPHSSEILKAFGPIILRQRKLSQTISLSPLNYETIDKDKLRAGISAIQQISLFLPDDPFKEIALSLVEAIREGMPKLSEEMSRLSGLIEEGKLRLADYFEEHPESESTTMAGWENTLKVSPSNASFLLSLIARVILEKRAGEITAVLGDFAWEKGYCPICGEFPSIALIEEEGGKRFLHCSSCGQDWRFTRVICPYCEKEGQTGMDYFYVEKHTQESAFVCDKCKKYLITLYRAGRLLARDMDVSAISLIHLDMIMQDKGYEPMVACAWNVLK